MSIIYSFSNVPAGRNFGIHPWRDSVNPQFAYHMRETNPSQSGIEFVKINLELGNVVFNGPTWLYASDLDDLGACFTSQNINFDGQLAGSESGGLLYLTASNWTTNPAVIDSVIIELDQATGIVQQHWATQTGGSQERSGKTSVMTADGGILARAGDQFYTGGGTVFDHSTVELLRPATGDYGYVNINADLGITDGLGWLAALSSPIVFDDSDFLWFLTQPWLAGAPRGDRISGPSTLYKCTVNAGNPITLTIVNSWAVPDNYHGYAAGVGPILSFAETFAYRLMDFNKGLGKIYLWSSWRDNQTIDDTEGWFLEFDINSETFTRGGVGGPPIPWTIGQPTTQRVRYDAVGWSERDFLATVSRGAGAASDAEMNVFQISTASETTFPLVSTFGYSITAQGDDLSDAAFFHSAGASADAFEVYAFDTGFVGTIYRDALFVATEDSPEPPPLGAGAPAWLAELGPIHNDAPAPTYPVTPVVPPYHADAVHLDGTAWLTRLSVTNVDDPLFAASFWFKSWTSPFNFAVPFVVDAAVAYLSWIGISTNNGKVETRFSDSAEFNTIHSETAVQAYGATWHHLLIAADCGQPNGSKKLKVYLDDVDITAAHTDGSSAFNIAISGQRVDCGNDTFGDTIIGDWADMWVATGVDLFTGPDVDAATRRLFTTALNKPIDPTTFPGTPLILFSGDAAGFGTNQGTGGAFTQTGVFTDASTSPSD